MGMADKHLVRFEPVGIEIEVGEEQTILRAASEQGLMLMHGCKEGQCAACKSFVLDGEDIELDKYSTFALPDFEKDEGFTLLCRAHVYEDVTIELLNYDEDMIKSGLPLQRATAEVAAIEEVTHDLRHVTLTLLDPTELRYFPGQYVDVTVPGHGVTRSFSMANTPTGRAGTLEFVIKVYPDGRFSSLLSGGGLSVGDRVEVVGPYGVFTLREGSDARIVLVGGGAGMAPDPGPAAGAGRARVSPGHRLLLRRPDHARPVLRGRAARAGADAAELPLRAGPVRAGRCRRRLGRRDRPHHRRAQADGRRA